mgnify:CR=1 FL=1
MKKPVCRFDLITPVFCSVTIANGVGLWYNDCETMRMMRREVAENMKKKIFAAAAIAAVVAAALSGCGGTTVADPSAASSSTAASAVESMPLSEVQEDNLNGLLTYLTGNGVIKSDTSEMKAEMIGAVAGKRVAVIYGDQTANVELYEFDTSNLNDRANEVLKNAKENKKFSSIDGEMPAMISNSGKYLLIYKDIYTDDQKRPVQERFLKLFQEFAPTGNQTTSSDGVTTDSATE